MGNHMCSKNYIKESPAILNEKSALNCRNGTLYSYQYILKKHSFISMNISEVLTLTAKPRRVFHSFTFRCKKEYVPMIDMCVKFSSGGFILTFSQKNSQIICHQLNYLLKSPVLYKIQDVPFQDVSGWGQQCLSSFFCHQNNQTHQHKLSIYIDIWLSRTGTSTWCHG